MTDRPQPACERSTHSGDQNWHRRPEQLIVRWWAPNGTLMAHGTIWPQKERRPSVRKFTPAWTFILERVTGIEPALSAWESVPSGPVTWPDLRGGVSASDRERPLVTGVNGPLMARRLDLVEGPTVRFQA
jgi:hypothetical protein